MLLVHLYWSMTTDNIKYIGDIMRSCRAIPIDIGNYYYILPCVGNSNSERVSVQLHCECVGLIFGICRLNVFSLVSVLSLQDEMTATETSSS